MRFYLKLVLMTAAFALSGLPQARESAAHLAFDVRVAVVCRFGTTADVENLLEDTQRAQAEACGGLDYYLKCRRHQQLLAQALAVSPNPLNESEMAKLYANCAEQAFGPTDASAAACDASCGPD